MTVSVKPTTLSNLETLVQHSSMSFALRKGEVQFTIAHLFPSYVNLCTSTREVNFSRNRTFQVKGEFAMFSVLVGAIVWTKKS